jgi:hypothetical protein
LHAAGRFSTIAAYNARPPLTQDVSMTRFRHALAALLVLASLAGSHRSAANGIEATAGDARLGLLLTQPALRVLPDSPPPQLTGEARLQNIAFAEAAGVAALQSKGHVRVVDVGTGAAIGDFAIEAAGALSLSPNGRVLTVAGNRGVEVLAADTGERLATLRDVRGGRVFWLGAQTLASEQSGGLLLRDLVTGAQTTLSFDARGIAGVAPVPGMPDRFVVVSARRVAQIELPHAGAPRLVRDVERPGKSLRSSDDVASGPDGTLYFGNGTAVSVLDPATLAITEWSFAPLRILRAGPMPNPDTVLVELTGGTRSRGAFVYSRSRQSLAPLADVPGGAERLRYVPALHRLVAVDAGNALLLDRVATGEANYVLTLIEELEYELATAEAEASERLDRYGESIGTSYDSSAGRWGKRKPAASATKNPRP